MHSGATLLPNSRRQRRPFSQSCQLRVPLIGIEGAFGFEFIGHLAKEHLTLLKNTVLWQARKPRHFRPVQLQRAT